MNYKKKSIIVSIFLITIIQILLLNNNKQKTSFRYLTWTIQDVSIGRLICVSFISGLLMSSILKMTENNNLKTYPQNEENNKNIDENEYSTNIKDHNESYEMPPERDLRDSQPTISVNYRVIKENDESELKDRKQTSNKNQSLDDWNKNASDW